MVEATLEEPIGWIRVLYSYNWMLSGIYRYTEWIIWNWFHIEIELRGTSKTEVKQFEYELETGLLIEFEGLYNTDWISRLEC